jgi:hypothetical protein
MSIAVQNPFDSPEPQKSSAISRLLKRLFTFIPIGLLLYLFGSGFISLGRVLTPKGVLTLAVLMPIYIFFSGVYLGLLEEIGALDKSFYERWYNRPIQAVWNRIRLRPPTDQEWESFGRVKMITYGAYLASDEWADKRAYMLRTAGHRCQVCNSRERLEVRHRTYKRIGQEVPQDLTVLCRSCHEAIHSSQPLGR